MIHLAISVLVLFFATFVHAVAPPPASNDQAGASADVGAGIAPKPPFDLMDPVRIAAGKTRFGSNCAAYCHGNEGVGGKTKAFKGRSDFTPETLFKVISEGRIEGADVMPPFAGMPEEKRWELVAYILHLGRQKADK